MPVVSGLAEKAVESVKKYYETVSELVNIKVIERNTELALFLDGEDKTIDKSIEMIYGNSGNITSSQYTKSFCTIPVDIFTVQRRICQVHQERLTFSWWCGIFPFLQVV